MVTAYSSLHKLGKATSIEVWVEKEMVGGLYGVVIGKCFSGESMFTRIDNASKVAFSDFAKRFFESGGRVIDCQIRSDLFSLFGGFEITRIEFGKIWKEGLD